MTEREMKRVVEKQRSFFGTGATLSVDFRIRALEKLRRCIRENEGEIARALKKDLGKSPFESYMCETGLVLDEIGYMLRHIRTLAREKRVSAPPVPLPKLQETVTLRSRTDHESVELSVFTDHRTSDRCHRGGEYGGFKAQRLFARYRRADRKTGEGVL